MLLYGPNNVKRRNSKRIFTVIIIIISPNKYSNIAEKKFKMTEH